MYQSERRWGLIAEEWYTRRRRWVWGTVWKYCQWLQLWRALDPWREAAAGSVAWSPQTGHIARLGCRARRPVIADCHRHRQTDSSQVDQSRDETWSRTSSWVLMSVPAMPWYTGDQWVGEDHSDGPTRCGPSVVHSEVGRRGTALWRRVFVGREDDVPPTSTEVTQATSWNHDKTYTRQTTNVSTQNSQPSTYIINSFKITVYCYNSL